MGRPSARFRGAGCRRRRVSGLLGRPIASTHEACACPFQGGQRPRCDSRAVATEAQPPGIPQCALSEVTGPNNPALTPPGGHARSTCAQVPGVRASSSSREWVRALLCERVVGGCGGTEQRRPVWHLCERSESEATRSAARQYGAGSGCRRGTSWRSGSGVLPARNVGERKQY